MKKDLRSDRKAFRTAINSGDTSLAAALRAKRPVATARIASRQATRMARGKKQVGQAGAGKGLKTTKAQARTTIKAAIKQRNQERK